MSAYGTEETYAKSDCDNCGKRWRNSELEEIDPEHYAERVDGNGPVSQPGEGLEPNGECPECGALCYDAE